MKRESPGSSRFFWGGKDPRYVTGVRKHQRGRIPHSQINGIKPANAKKNRRGARRERGRGERLMRWGGEERWRDTDGRKLGRSWVLGVSCFSRSESSEYSEGFPLTQRLAPGLCLLWVLTTVTVVHAAVCAAIEHARAALSWNKKNRHDLVTLEP